MIQFRNLGFQRSADFVAYAKERLVLNCVVGVQPVLATADDAEAAEHTQVLRHVLLGGAECTDQLLNRLRFVAQLLQDAQADGLTDRAKPFSDQFDELLWQLVVGHRYHPHELRTAVILTYN